MAMAGFLVKELRVEDPFEPAFKNTPKALMVVGHKSPRAFLGKSAKGKQVEVRITDDSLDQLQLRAITISETEGWLSLVTEDEKKPTDCSPLPR
jgi:hypothetical protein